MMQKCPNCGHMNRPGVLICEKCGTNLATGKSQISTKALGQEAQDQLAPKGNSGTSALRQPSGASVNAADKDTPPAPSQPTMVRRGTDEFPKGGTLRLEVEGSSKSVQVPLTVHNREIVLGRRDPATGVLPDIDLTPFAGYRMGVSRRHGLIRYSEGKFLDLFDQGSSNGTFLNGQRMDAHYPYRLRDGDRIRLGQITIRMHFDPGNVAAQNPVESSTEEKRKTSPLGMVKPKPPAKPLAAPQAAPDEKSKASAAPIDEATKKPEPPDKARAAPTSKEPKKPEPPTKPATSSSVSPPTPSTGTKKSTSGSSSSSTSKPTKPGSDSNDTTSNSNDTANSDSGASGNKQAQESTPNSSPSKPKHAPKPSQPKPPQSTDQQKNPDKKP